MWKEELSEFLPLLVVSGHPPDGSSSLLEGIFWGGALWRALQPLWLFSSWPSEQHWAALSCEMRNRKQTDKPTPGDSTRGNLLWINFPKWRNWAAGLPTCQFISHPQCHTTEHWVLLQLLQFAWFTCTGGNGGGEVSICLSIKVWDLGKQRSAWSNSQYHSLRGIIMKKTNHTAERLIVINWPRNLKLWLCIAAKQELIPGSR